METYLDVHTAGGMFMHGLQPNQIVLLEDEQPVRNVNLTEISPGAQLVVAINPGSEIALRNSQGVSRYDLIYQALAQWTFARAGSSIDDLSLLVTDGRSANHLSDPEAWLAALPTALTDARQAVPSLDNLSQAVDLAADPSPRAGMGRAVLWITPPLENNQNLALADMASRAIQQGINIYIWLVTASDTQATNRNEPLIALATQTGGQFFQFTGQETLPDLETYVEPHRNIYYLTYTSQVRQSGTHEISVEIHGEVETISTRPQSYTIDLQAPNPAFINPPLSLTRQPPEELTGVAAADVPIADYSPSELDLQILVDFPDQRMRGLVRTALWVDGVVVDENTAPPFDIFQWDLRTVSQSGPHTLQVIAEDVLGLSGSSMNTLIEINVERPANSFWVLLARNTPILIGLAVLLTGAVAFLLMVVGGRIHPRRLPSIRRRGTKPAPAPPAASQTDADASQAWTGRLHWPQRRIKPQAEAYLTSLATEEAPGSAPPFALTASEITIGSDPQRATLVLSDPSVDGLHARVARNEAGAYILTDAGSTAGTWINFCLLPPDGICLEHNDLIHIGRSRFRFTLAHPAHIRKPVIRIQDQADPLPPPEDPK
ncbi:MAG TPA: FHA domain-containing protein [Anaerolineales bacterium]|nr:FHA domain-containing protein [Anaerolineales bacterium]